jgi:hypothetical protein
VVVQPDQQLVAIIFAVAVVMLVGGGQASGAWLYVFLLWSWLGCRLFPKADTKTLLTVGLAALSAFFGAYAVTRLAQGAYWRAGFDIIFSGFCVTSAFAAGMHKGGYVELNPSAVTKFPAFPISPIWFGVRVRLSDITDATEVAPKWRSLALPGADEYIRLRTRRRWRKNYYIGLPADERRLLLQDLNRVLGQA